jgi:hypothetical protein
VPQGLQGPSAVVGVKESRETWSEFELRDGTLVRVRPTLSAVKRELNRYNPNGDPVYHLVAGMNVVVVVPDHLKQGYKAPKRSKMAGRRKRR